MVEAQANGKLERVVEARLRLKARFDAQARTAAGEDTGAPRGSGEPNRHGMPRLPIGQTQTTKWPVLDLGVQPQISREDWRVELCGACNNPVTLCYDELLGLTQTSRPSDFHCVTTWSRFDIRWRGVRFSELAAVARVTDGATHVMCWGSDEYCTNLSLFDALKPDVLLAHAVDGTPLTREHGGPVRMVTPQLYAWKGAKWISRIEFMLQDRPGFWEERGYSMTANPWRNDRYIGEPPEELVAPPEDMF